MSENTDQKSDSSEAETPWYPDLRQDVAELREDLRDTRYAAIKAQDELQAWKDIASRWRWTAIVSVIAVVTIVGFDIWLSPAPATSTPVVNAPDDGYYVDTETGLHLVPWPDASGYAPETFLEDCRQLCETPSMTNDPGRVLTVDPRHLVCVCFHEGSSFPVTRWVNWERRN